MYCITLNITEHKLNCTPVKESVPFALIWDQLYCFFIISAVKRYQFFTLTLFSVLICLYSPEESKGVQGPGQRGSRNPAGCLGCNGDPSCLSHDLHSLFLLLYTSEPEQWGKERSVRFVSVPSFYTNINTTKYRCLDVLQLLKMAYL